MVSPEDRGMTNAPRTTIVIATRNRRERVCATLQRFASERARIIVVDNGSSDGTSAKIRLAFPHVEVITLPENVGAFARNIGVSRATTPYIACADDDTWWLPGSLDRGEAIFDSHPRIGLLNALVTLDDNGRCDPTCELMAGTAAEDGMPGTPIAFFMAGCSMFRRRAFLEAGGYNARFMIGAEETLLAIDLQRNGWRLRFVPSLIVRHEPFTRDRNDALRQRLVSRNRLWSAWMRLTPANAWRITVAAVIRAMHDRTSRWGLFDALAGLPWVICQRKAIGDELSAWLYGHWSAES